MAKLFGKVGQMRRDFYIQRMCDLEDQKKEAEHKLSTIPDSPTDTNKIWWTNKLKIINKDIDNLKACYARGK